MPVFRRGPIDRRASLLAVTTATFNCEVTGFATSPTLTTYRWTSMITGSVLTSHILFVHSVFADGCPGVPGCHPGSFHGCTPGFACCCLHGCTPGSACGCLHCCTPDFVVEYTSALGCTPGLNLAKASSLK